MRIILILCTAFMLLSAGEPKFTSVKMVDGVTVSMPKDFVQMSDDDIANKYPSTKKPVAMYTNLDRTVDFGLNISKSRWGGVNLTILKDIYHSTIVESYDTVTFLKEDVIAINGRPYARYEYTALFDGTEGYHYLLISILAKTIQEAETDPQQLTPGNSNHLLIFNFYCPKGLQSAYQAIAEAMMQSIHVNTNLASKAIPAVVQPPVRGLTSPQQVLEDQKKRATKGK